MHSLYTIQLHGPLDTSFTFVVEGAACPGPNFSKRITGPGQGGREQSAPPGIGRRFLNQHGGHDGGSPAGCQQAALSFEMTTH